LLTYNFLSFVNKRNFFTDITKYNINNYYNKFRTDDDYYIRTYSLAYPLFRNDIDCLLNFYSGNYNIYPYVQNTIPYFYTLDNLYIIGNDNVFLMNKEDINNITYNKMPIEINLDKSIEYSNNNNMSNHISYFYLKNKEKMINISNVEKSSKLKNNSISIKYNYNISNYVLHQVFRMFLKLNKTNHINSFNLNLDNFDDINNFIYLVLDKYDFIQIRNIIKKNELLFLIHIISNYLLYDNTFHPKEILNYVNTNNNNINLNFYEIDINCVDKKCLNLSLDNINLEPMGFDMNISFKKIQNKMIKIKTKYDFFIFITDNNLDYVDVLWDMKSKGLIYTMLFNKIGDYIIIRAPSIFPMDCINYLKKLCNGKKVYSILSEKSNNIDLKNIQ
jgi:hypothetical protein